MNMSKIDMTQGSILGRAAQFALPICIGNILQQLYGTVDTLVIGNFCDASALAAVATSSQPLEILLCIFLYLSVFPTEFHIERLSGHIYRNVDHYIAHHSNHFPSSV